VAAGADGRIAVVGQELLGGIEAHAHRFLGAGRLVTALDGAVAARLRDVAGAAVVFLVAIQLGLAVVADLAATGPQTEQQGARDQPLDESFHRLVLPVSLPSVPVTRSRHSGLVSR